MTNEKTAKQIARSLAASDEYPYDYLSAYAGAIEAMEWKDEQFLQWLKETLTKETFTMFTSESQGVINFEPVIKAFEKFIKQ